MKKPLPEDDSHLQYDGLHLSVYEVLFGPHWQILGLDLKSLSLDSHGGKLSCRETATADALLLVSGAASVL